MNEQVRESKCDFNIKLLRDSVLLEMRPKKTHSGIILSTDAKDASKNTIYNTDMIIRGYGEATNTIEIGDKVIIRTGSPGIITNIKDSEHPDSIFVLDTMFTILGVDKRDESQIKSSPTDKAVVNKTDKLAN